MDFLDVGGADAAGGDFDQQLTGLDLRDGNGFETKVVGAVIDDGLHGVGDGKWRVASGEWRVRSVGRVHKA